MTERESPDRGNVQRQLALFEVARQARGKDMAEIRGMISSAFARRQLPNPPGPWLDAAATEAHYGEPYIVDLPAAVAVDELLPVSDPNLEATLSSRRRVRQAEGLPTGLTQKPRAAAPSTAPADTTEAGAVPPGLVTVRAIVAGAIGLTLVLAAVEIIRAISRSHTDAVHGSPGVLWTAGGDLP